jgi:Flp pilus assembly protein TadG
MSKHRNSRGTAMVETAFMMPWLAFLFIGILDVVFYYYAAICTQEAARVAAIQYASFTSDTCIAAIGALNGLPNMIGVSTCAGPVVTVTATPLTATCPDVAVNAATSCEQVAVTYTTIPMIPIPGILTGKLTITRTAVARILQ